MQHFDGYSHGAGMLDSGDERDRGGGPGRYCLRLWRPVKRTRRRSGPWLYSFLIAPSAVMMNGVVQGGVPAYLLSVQGVGSGGQSRLIFLLSLPTWLYFLWSPITDFFIRRRTWALLGGILAAAFMALAFHSGNLASKLPLAVMFLSACCSQLVVSSVGGMMGAMHWSATAVWRAVSDQAGSMGFGALAAWVLIWLSSRTGRDGLGLTAGLLIVVPALFALAAPRHDISVGTFAATMRRVWGECNTTFFRWEGRPIQGAWSFPWRAVPR